ncbi:hypothetical protein [Actinoplanes subglobosus]|uniref:Lipoprotein n=1 Tax=Actinoplanes subglobosus TaxID=1547892 RepID=A0ABV8J8K9_9ACTN
MTTLTGSRRARLVSSAATFVVLAVAGCTPAGDTPSGTPVTGTPVTSASVAGASVAPMIATSEVPKPRDGWKTVDHSGVQVDVPADWLRPDTTGCEFTFVQWAPPGSPPCRMTTGVVFYSAATFDPAHGPGVRQNEDKTWAGYVFAGDLAVYAAGTDRELVQDVLDTARPPRRR